MDVIIFTDVESLLIVIVCTYQLNSAINRLLDTTDIYNICFEQKNMHDTQDDAHSLARFDIVTVVLWSE